MESMGCSKPTPLFAAGFTFSHVPLMVHPQRQPNQLQASLWGKLIQLLLQGSGSILDNRVPIQGDQDVLILPDGLPDPKNSVGVIITGYPLKRPFLVVITLLVTGWG